MPKGENFYNPYRMLRQPAARPECCYSPDLSKINGYIGWLQCKLEAHTPLEINYEQNTQFNRKPCIPGSSLKGIIRSIAEFIGNGCLSIRNKDEGVWNVCQLPQVCPTCDMFGRLKGKMANKGKVFFTDAKVIEYEKHHIIRLYQGQPKEEHEAFYPQGNGRAFRKFYHHHPSAQKRIRRKNSHENDSILYPVKSGSAFEFKVHFEGLDARELAVLLYALRLEPGLLHKMGRGKAHGLGSVKIKIEEFSVQVAKDRYLGEVPAKNMPEDVLAQIDGIENNPDLLPLRKMLSWEAAKALEKSEGGLRYPRFHWFKKNSTKKLRTVDEVIQNLPYAEDPTPPSLQKPIQYDSSKAQKASVSYEKPKDFDEEMWKQLNALTRSLVIKITAIGSYKSDSQPFIDRYLSEDTSAEEKKAIVEALRVLIPKNEHDWIREKLGAEALPKKKAEAEQKQQKKSYLEEAIERVKAAKNGKAIRKKVLAKYFGKQKLDEQEKKKVAKAIKNRCGELGIGEEEIRKMKDLQPYLD